MKDVLEQIARMKIDLSEADVLERLFDRKRFPQKYHDGFSSIDMIMDDGEKDESNYLFKEDGYLDSQKAVSAYLSGYTLILSDVGFLFEQTARLQYLLNDSFDQEVWCNFYFGKGERTPSFPPHSHPYEVIVKNIFGKSEWVIDSNAYIVQDQDVLYLPKESLHQVTKIFSTKLSITCNILGG